MDIIQRKKDVQALFVKPENMKQLAMALPNVGLTKDRMVRLMFSSLNQTPKLLECSPQTLFNAMIQCATLGLEPNTPLGHAYLIPFQNNKKGMIDVQLIIGYKGYLSLARRARELVSVSSHIVREGDDFTYQYGTEEWLKHVPKADNEESPIIYAYAVAQLKDGGVAFELMSKRQIDIIRARSKSSNTGPWVTDYDQMARKTVIRRLMNYLPLSIELAQAVALDSRNEVGDTDNLTDIIDIDIMPQERKVDKPTGLAGMAATANKNLAAPAPPPDDDKPFDQQTEAGVGSSGLTTAQQKVKKGLAYLEEKDIAEVLQGKPLIGELSDKECIEVEQRINAVMDGKIE